MKGSLDQGLLLDLRRDERGGALVEFALLAPVFITLMVGVVQVGVHVQNSNAVRNLASDGARFAVVESQRGNGLTTNQLAAIIYSHGIGPKYVLDHERLTVEVTEPASRITGVDEMRIEVTYNAPDYLAFVDSEALQLNYARPVFLMP